jgi:hypothetical protein
MTHHDFFLVLTSVCEHSDYRLLLGTSSQVPTNRSWAALLRHSKSGVVVTVSVSDHMTPNDAIEDIFRQLDVPETVPRSIRPDSLTPAMGRQVHHPLVSGQHRSRPPHT